MLDEQGYIANAYQQFIHTARYARWREADLRRETWTETIERYTDYMSNYMETRYGHNFDKSLKQDILSMNILPSMRALVTAGPALEKSAVAAYNCLAPETKVLTKEFGLQEISKSLGAVNVLTGNGIWEPAEIKSFGTQFVGQIKFSFGSRVISVDATKDHRWYLSDGTIKTSSQLQPNDKVDYIASPKVIDDEEDYRLGIIHGLVFGDGTAIHTKERSFGYQIRLCGNSKQLVTLFNDCQVNYPKSYNGDPIVFLRNKFAITTPLKELPDNNESDSYLIGFIRGWFAADGSVSKRNQVTLCSERVNLVWLLKNGPRVGFNFSEVIDSMPNYTNYGRRKTDTCRIKFDRATFLPEDAIIQEKANNVKPLSVTYSVKSVDFDINVYSTEVFCAIVPGTNNFVIEQGLLTGNCAYMAVDSIKAFDETMFILMNGTGVGFSVESENVNRLPTIPDDLEQSDHVIVVQDSREGWARSLRVLITTLYSGQIPNWDTSKVRPAGERLKTFGGRASGPAPLESLFRFIIDTFINAKGRKLNSLEAHDIMCKIGEVVVAGSVRRSALISLSDINDSNMQSAKNGQFWNTAPHRAMANNSAVYHGKPSIEVFLKEWTNLVCSGSGERGIFNRKAAQKQASLHSDRDNTIAYGLNPCGEIILRSNEFCNLTSVPVQGNESLEELKLKVEKATKLGTYQACIDHFHYLKKDWKRNAEEERLLGVSISGIFGHPVLNGSQGLDKTAQWLDELRLHARKTNEKLAKQLGIAPSAAITCIKPEGNSSQLTNTSSGIHPWYAQYYVRTVRGDKKDPLNQFLKDAGVPCEDDLMKPEVSDVFSFPIKAPEGALLRSNVTALQHLELWLIYKKHWCEHNPSITINVREDEWLEVGKWVYDHFDEVCGIAFLPHSEHVYQQAPYQEITKEQYEELVNKMPKLYWNMLGLYETNDDSISNSRELNCTANQCEIVSI